MGMGLFVLNRIFLADCLKFSVEQKNVSKSMENLFLIVIYNVDSTRFSYI